MKNRVILLLLALLLVFSLTSCNNGNGAETDGADTRKTENVTKSKSGDKATGAELDAGKNNEKKTESQDPVESGTHVHTEEIIPGKAATCAETGLTEGKKCSVCNEILTKQKTVAATLNHHFVRQNTTFKCSVCGLEVLECGNADGSICGGNDHVKYYVTGDPVNDSAIEIVIYGTGAMPDFSTTNHPLWFNYLLQARKIIIGQGITTIGAYAFYNCDATEVTCQIEISNTVKVIRSHAINLKINRLVLGAGVETVQSDAIGNVNSIYIPKSVKDLYIDCLGNETYFYEGTLEDFYKINMLVYNKKITVKDFLKTLDEDFKSNIHIYVQAKDITDRSHYWR